MPPRSHAAGWIMTLFSALIALDRQEKGNGELSAIQEVEKEFGIPVVSIIRLEQILDYLKANPDFAGHAGKVASYRDRYGV